MKIWSLHRFVGFLVVGQIIISACTPDIPREKGADFTLLTQPVGDAAQARAGVGLEFPRDHGPHPDFRIEWWYLTANLKDEQGQAYGIQWTLFRTAMGPSDAPQPVNPWQSRQVFMAHMAITTPTAHAGFQRYARGGEHDGVARAGARAEPFGAWLDDWILESTGPEWLPLRVQARAGNHAFRLELNSERPLVPQGDNGFSQKHPDGGGSHYYSHPFLEARGTLSFDGVEVEVAGRAWLDREWSSRFLGSDQAGWDWFAIHLESGEKLMLFRLRPAEGAAIDPWLHAVLISPSGEKQPLDPAGVRLEALSAARVAGRDLPLHWRVELPEIERSFEVTALHPQQWMGLDYAYWEGVVRVSGAGPGNNGIGYLELTGYRPR